MLTRSQRSNFPEARALAAKWAALALLALCAGFAPATALGQTSDTTAVDPAARAALDRMGAYLRTLQAFQVEASSEREVVLENGLKIQSEWSTNLLARKPDRLLVSVTSDSQQRDFFYNGKLFTLWAPRTDFYATVPAPPTIGELIRTLEEKFDIEVPLVDLFRWGTGEANSAAITVAMDLGPATVAGATCHHYAFRQEGLDWQVWIQEGEYPLPRKLVLTTTTDEARPQFAATYTWNLAPSFNDAAFTFVPPPEAHQILLAANSPVAGAKP